MTRRLLHLICFTLAAAVLLPAAAAQGAKSAPLPVVTKIDPLRLGIGDTMTLSGKNFRKGVAKNTVVFKRDGKAAIFVKAGPATATRMSVTLPEKLRSSLSRQQGGFVATRFRVRVLAKRFAKRYTKLSASPVVEPLAIQVPAPLTATGPATVPATVPGAPATAAAPAGTAPATSPTVPTVTVPRVDAPTDCDNDGTPNSAEGDDDADLLVDALEGALKTDACKLDTDGDGMEDGWEYQSAVDLNRDSCAAVEYPTPCAPATPAPTKRAYTNPLYADADVDYDGDWLASGAEHAAWKRKGVRNLANLWYSDGRQASQETSPSDGCRGIDAGLVTPLANQPAYSIDRDGDGCLTDDERDEDNDFLTNREELVGGLSSLRIWTVTYDEPAFRVAHEGTDFLDGDTDGDTIVDGKDDQDHDDFWNVEELRRGTQAYTKKDVANPQRTGLWVDPFNPCLPSPTSRTCPRGLPLEGDIWRPFTDPKADDPVTPRWPLYGTFIYSSGISGPEQWDGPVQTEPPTHPLLPRPS